MIIQVIRVISDFYVTRGFRVIIRVIRIVRVIRVIRVFKGY